MKKLLIGSHVSTQSGLYRSAERAASIDCPVFQIFTKNNRQWFCKPLKDTEITEFKNAVKNNNIISVFSHASYLINLASPDKEVRKKSLHALQTEIERCHQLSIECLVLHPGSHVNQTPEKGLNLIVEGLNQAFQNQSHTNVTVALETMAGQGSSLGSTLEELAYIIQNSTYKNRLGICVDTCHIFAAGYNFCTKETYKKYWQQFDTIIGKNYLKVIHVNDSKKEYGSKVDRHEHIGQGKIGKDAFSLLFNDSTLATIPKILETPKASLDDDKRNIDLIKTLLK